MKLLRKISFPFNPAYYVVTWLRNKFYDNGILGSSSYETPIICVGNLSVGGTGKTPLVEYLIRLLKNEHKIAVLSRGYKRKTKGFVLADENATANSIGDEPMQFHEKFQDITVAVDADRRNGISHLLTKNIDAIILDDAFQHRKVEAGLNILLTTYSRPFYKDYILPSGTLREPRSGFKRADIIIVTKCPEDISKEEKDKIIKKIKPQDHQLVFFSWIGYGELPKEVTNAPSLTLVTGIANPRPLVEHLNSRKLEFDHLKFGDHHDFNDAEINLFRSKEMVLTTEKDYMRLKGRVESDRLFFLPIEMKIDNAKDFDDRIKRFVKDFKKH